MSTLLTRFPWLALSLVAMALSFVSCSSDSGETRYIAAKLAGSDMWSIVDVKNGDIVYKDEFKSQPSVIVNDKFCVKNESGLYDYFTVDDVKKPINSESYMCATAFNKNGVALVVRRGKGISVINGNCEIVADLDNSIETASSFSYGYALVFSDSKVGYINEKGEVVVNPSYDVGGPFSEDGIAIVGKKLNDSTTKYSAIDTKGEELFSFSSDEYGWVGVFNGGLLPVMDNGGEVVLLDKTGKKCYTVGKWTEMQPWPTIGFNDGVIVFNEGGACGLKDENGKVVVRAKYDALIPLSGINPGYYLALKRDKVGVVDKDDNIVVPFDYTNVGYINKNTLFAVSGDSVVLLDNKLNVIGDNHFINLSFMPGSDIYSNYFDAEKEAARIISKITDSTFFKTGKGMTLRDFEDRLSGYKYTDMEKSVISEQYDMYSLTYGFDRNLSSQRYEYVYGMKLPTKPEYNYDANLVTVVATTDIFKRFEPGAEESLAKAFDAQIQKLGYAPVDGVAHCFKNDRDMAVGLAYDNGKVSVMCSYNPQVKMEVERIPRSVSSGIDVEADHIDAFNLDHGKELAPVDSVALVDIVDLVDVEDIAE